MSTTVGPFTLTLNTALTIQDAGASDGVGSDSVQLQNSSVFVVSVVAAGLTYTIQSFTAQTVPLIPPTGEPIVVTPIVNSQVIPGAPTAGALMAVFLNAGEAPPMTDGPLTAAATAAAIGVFAASGSADIAVTAVATVVGTPVPFTPAPAVGFVNRVGTLTISTGASVASVLLQGVTSLGRYMQIDISTAGSPPIPFDVQLSEASQFEVLSGAVPSRICSYYRPLLLV